MINNSKTRSIPKDSSQPIEITPAIKTEQLWDRVKYTLATRNTSMDVSSSGITFEPDGDSIIITVPAETSMMSSPSDGAWLFWEMKDSLTLDDVDFGSGTGFQGILRTFISCEVLSGTEPVDVTWGYSDGDAPTDANCLSGLYVVDPNVQEVVVWRTSTSTNTWLFNAASIALAGVTAVNCSYSPRVRLGQPNQHWTSIVNGSTDADPRNLFVTSSEVTVTVAMNRNMGKYLALNVSNFDATVDEVKIRVKLQAVVLDWRQ